MQAKDRGEKQAHLLQPYTQMYELKAPDMGYNKQVLAPDISNSTRTTRIHMYAVVVCMYGLVLQAANSVTTQTTAWHFLEGIRIGHRRSSLK